LISNDPSYFRELQTQTGWGRTLSSFAEWCAPQPGWRTLDVGCGPGLLPALFAQSHCLAVGIDLDPKMLRPPLLHPIVAIADVYNLPFRSQTFDLITASNLLFLLPEPIAALREMKRLLHPGGRVALLNPSEHLSMQTATAFADERGLQGLARDTLLNWAQRAEANRAWTEAETLELFANAGIQFMACALKIGPGFGRFSCGTI
jgi:ubiquinone/menaquinone biosynthesis C-methylase UbiE